MKQSKVQSYGLLITSMLIFGSVGIFRRLVPLSSAFIALVRGIVGGGCLFLVSRIQHRKNAKIGTKTVFLLALIGGLIGFNWVFLFEAYRYTTVATATLCYYMQPTIVILISPLVFREPVSLKKMLCAAVSLVGMVMVSGVLSGGEVMAENGKGIAFGLAAAALYAAIVHCEFLSLERHFKAALDGVQYLDFMMKMQLERHESVAAPRHKGHFSAQQRLIEHDFSPCSVSIPTFFPILL